MHVESNFPEAGTRSQSGEVGTGGKDGARGISNSGKTQIISRYLLARRRSASLVAHRPPPAWSATNRGNTRDRVGRSTERRGRKAHGWRQTSVLTQARRREAWRRALPFTASGKPVLIPGVLTCGETAASGDLKVPPMARHVWTPEVLKSGEVLESDEVLKKQSRWSPG